MPKYVKISNLTIIIDETEIIAKKLIFRKDSGIMARISYVSITRHKKR